MTDFFADPILDSPYEPPSRHWELEGEGRPTGRVLAGRRRAEFIAAVSGSSSDRQPNLFDLDDPNDEAALQTAMAEMRALSPLGGRCRTRSTGR